MMSDFWWLSLLCQGLWIAWFLHPQYAFVILCTNKCCSEEESPAGGAGPLPRSLWLIEQFAAQENGSRNTAFKSKIIRILQCQSSGQSWCAFPSFSIFSHPFSMRFYHLLRWSHELWRLAGLSAQWGRHARRQNLNGWHALETRGQNGLGAWDFLKSDNSFSSNVFPQSFFEIFLVSANVTSHQNIGITYTYNLLR